ncbi:FAD-dependent oxidoreductase [Rhodococcus sp. 06-235-1A]|uniref:FAD-dependent oxidoreductase n=1 Tax=Rhodococcus sp. 06-235-1A TaxID=2022508 RepID=UPI000B9A3096|nr:FAD-dependent oxidoreductase [Rhodococcus sp. 06-235-1A]OZC97152.1 FAD-dependent oxidoreductase [Rhodococcus sp. 06-235-1A]OZC97220.1 FAD-dependent oxidoreductase [Rhodococcus sp. 06-235-1A]
MKVVVVGGGIIGASSAWQIAGRGHDVTLLEQFGPGHKNGASHGSSRIFRHAYADDYYVSLAARAHSLWRDLETATDTALLAVTGAVDHGDPATVNPRIDALKRAGLEFEVLEPVAAQQRWPGLRFDTTVLFHAAAGRLHADRSVAAAIEAARSGGATVEYETPVREISGSDVVTDTRTYVADVVVLAAGAWTSEFVPQEVIPPLVTTQEQPAHFVPLRPEMQWPSFIHHPGALLDTAGIYGLSSPDGIKIGEHATGPVVSPRTRGFVPNPDGVQRLIDYAGKWLPGVDAKSADPSTCLYTSTPDSNFAITRSGNTVVAAGFSGHGFKFAPAVGEVVADLVDGSRRQGRA